MAGIDPISTVAEAASKIISLFKEDPTVKAQLGQQVELAELQGQIQIVLAQLQVNAVEAASKSTFVAGWRPWVGWVSGSSLCIPFIIYLLQCIVILFSGEWTHNFAMLTTLPKPDTTTLTTVLLAILGLGGMRSYDKAQGSGPDKS